jgi:hypothetical protein
VGRAPEAFDDIGERNVLHVANQAAAELGLAPAASVAELLQADGDALCTLPELDVYPARSGGAWCGPLVAASEGQPVPWPDGDGPCAYVSLGARHPLLHRWWRRCSSGQRAVLQVADAAPDQAASSPPTGIVVARTPVPVDAAAAPLQRTRCSTGTVPSRPGCCWPASPCCCCPRSSKTMLAHRVQALGAGLLLDDAAPALDVALRRLVDEPAWSTAATAFASRHHDHDDAHTLAAVVARCEALM